MRLFYEISGLASVAKMLFLLFNPPLVVVKSRDSGGGNNVLKKGCPVLLSLSKHAGKGLCTRPFDKLRVTGLLE
jgi:hypothetical protein